jgi:hypothetical protein
VDTFEEVHSIEKAFEGLESYEDCVDFSIRAINELNLLVEIPPKQKISNKRFGAKEVALLNHLIFNDEGLNNLKRTFLAPQHRQLIQQTLISKYGQAQIASVASFVFEHNFVPSAKMNEYLAYGKFFWIGSTGIRTFINQGNIEIETFNDLSELLIKVGSTMHPNPRSCVAANVHLRKTLTFWTTLICTVRKVSKSS